MNRIPRDLIRHLEWIPGTEAPIQPTSQPIHIPTIAGSFNIADRLEAAKIFYNTDLPSALLEAEAHAGTEGYVLSMPLLLEARLAVPKDHDFWKKWYTAVSEENVLTTPSGNHVLAVIHGGGILTAERIKQAYTEGLTPQKAAKYSSEESKGLLTGRLPDGTTIPMYEFDDFSRQNDLPVRYGVLLDFEKAKSQPSGRRPIEQLLDEPLVAIRSGGLERAKRYFEKARGVYSSDNQGSWHRFTEIDPSVPQGRLLFLGNDDNGLSGNLDDIGRFVGVGAPEARPR